ncbi:MAG: respiratory nitrate reductase subunit gamma [Chloroflexi bacterium]|nr:respiratory nitrate reductase subunit gamma [Chloroflexota bacterium]
MPVTLAIVGTIWRYKSDRFSVSSLSSQFLENRKLFWGSVPGITAFSPSSPGIWSLTRSHERCCSGMGIRCASTCWKPRRWLLAF